MRGIRARIGLWAFDQSGCLSTYAGWGTDTLKLSFLEDEFGGSLELCCGGESQDLANAD